MLTRRHQGGRAAGHDTPEAAAQALAGRHRPGLVGIARQKVPAVQQQGFAQGRRRACRTERRVVLGDAFERVRVDPDGLRVEPDPAVLQPHQFGAVRQQPAQPVQGDVERIVRGIGFIAGPQRIGQSSQRDRLGPECDQRLEHREGPLRDLAVELHRRAVDADGEVAERADVQCPGPLAWRGQRPDQRCRQVPAANQLAHERRGNAALECQAAELRKLGAQRPQQLVVAGLGSEREGARQALGRRLAAPGAPCLQGRQGEQVHFERGARAGLGRTAKRRQLAAGEVGVGPREGCEHGDQQPRGAKAGGHVAARHGIAQRLRMFERGHHPAALQGLPCERLLGKALVVHIGGRDQGLQFNQPLARGHIVGGVQRAQQQHRDGLELDHGKADLARLGARQRRSALRLVERTGLAVQVGRDLLAHQHPQQRADVRRPEQPLHAPGEQRRIGPALVPLHATEQRDGRGELVVLRAAWPQALHHGIGQALRMGLEFAQVEAREQFTVEEPPGVLFAVGRTPVGLRLPHDLAPTAVRNKAVGVVDPLQCAGGAEPFAVAIAGRYERAVGTLIVAERGAVFAQKGQPRQPVLQPGMAVLHGLRQALRPGKPLIELPHGELFLQNLEQPVERRHVVAGIEQQVDGGVDMAVAFERLRGIALDPLQGLRGQGAAAPVQQEGPEQRMQPEHAGRAGHGLDEEAVCAQALQIVGRLCVMCNARQQPGRHPRQQRAREQQLLRTRRQRVVQQAREIVEQALLRPEAAAL